MIGSHNLRDQTLALAGVAQAARIVDQLSRTGTYPVEYLEASLHSLFSFDASDVEGVFGNIQGVKLGLQNLAAGLAPGGDETAGAMMRYFFAILHLEGKFASRTDLQEVVHSRIRATRPSISLHRPMIFAIVLRQFTQTP